MTDYKMTDERRMILTEKLLGECWHIKKEPRTMSGYICERCGDYTKWGSGYDVNGNRTFTSDADMLAVFRKIRDAGKWVEFIGFVAKQMTLGSMHAEHFMIWLFLDNPERACCLAADFLEEQG